MNAFSRLLQELDATTDADGKVLFSFEKGEYHLILYIEGDLVQIVDEDCESVVHQARQLVADLRGEKLDEQAPRASAADVLDFTSHKRRRLSSAPFGGGDAA